METSRRLTHCPQANGEPADAALKELKASANEDDKDNTVYKEWKTEAKALEDTSGLGHPHMIQVKAIINKGKRHYFMFPWADGGSLRDLYKKDPLPGHKLRVEFIKDVVTQLEGLASALSELHHYNGTAAGNAQDPGTESYRHGDLKPENILRFLHEDGEGVGMWKIADMGLAKHHFAATGARGLRPTSTRFGTQLYEPPEVFTDAKGARSRLYDVWSMGCIILELIIWLLYGSETLNRFNNSLTAANGNLGGESPYWILETSGSSNRADLHPRVKEVIDHTSRDEECRGSTALGELLRIVRTKLLVIPLRRDSPSFAPTASEPAAQESPATPSVIVSGPHLSGPDITPGPFRATAQEFLQAIKKIQSHDSKERTYWFSGKVRRNRPGEGIPMGSTNLLPHTRNLAERGRPNDQLISTATPQPDSSLLRPAARTEVVNYVREIDSGPSSPTY